MENYTITKEQILAIEKVGGADVSLYLKETFPEVFKTELELNKWYKYKLALFYITNKISNNTNYYNVFGFDVDGNWMTDNATTYFDENYIEATPEEVEAALKYQAQKLGFKKGVRFIPLFPNGTNYRDNSVVEITEDEFLFQDNTLFTISEYRIFANGKWAQILPQKKTIVPMEKALKIIAKKMKVSPENIEIKN